MKPGAALALPFIALSLLSSCASVGQPSGIYAIKADEFASAWIGQPAGIPAWSPVGDSLAWGSEDGLAVTNFDDGTTRTLATTRIAGRPAWAPDGMAIAYFDEQSQSLTVINVRDGTIETTLPVATDARASSTVDLMTWGGPAWSVDGTQIAFVCWDGAGDELCVADGDGGHRRQITRLGPTTTANAPAGSIVTATSNIGPPAWAPDDGAIAVGAYPERSGAPSGLFIINLERGTARQISKLLPNSEINWAPDGNSLVFSVTEKGRSDVVRVSVADGKATKLTTKLAAGARSPALSPDGERIAAISQGTVVILEEDGSVSVSPGLGLKEAFPTWNEAGNLVAISANDDPISKYD